MPSSYPRYADNFIRELNFAKQQAARCGGTVEHWLGHLHIHTVRCYVEAIATVNRVPVFKAQRKADLIRWLLRMHETGEATEAP